MDDDIAYYEQLQREQEEFEAQVGFPQDFIPIYYPLIRPETVQGIVLRVPPSLGQKKIFRQIWCQAIE